MSRVCFATILAVSFVAAPALASPAQSVGRLTAVTSNVFVARDGKMIQAYAGQPLLQGDKVITRGKSAAQVSLTGCGYRMVSKTVLAINTTCATASMVNGGQDQGGAGAGAAGPTTTEILVGAAALTAVTVGIVEATRESGPVSP